MLLREDGVFELRSQIVVEAGEAWFVDVGGEPGIRWRRVRGHRTFEHP